MRAFVYVVTSDKTFDLYDIHEVATMFEQGLFDVIDVMSATDVL